MYILKNFRQEKSFGVLNNEIIKGEVKKLCIILKLN